MHSQSDGVEVERGWRWSKPPRQSEFCQQAIPQATRTRPARGFFFARKTLQAFARRRSNTPMQARNLAKAARPRPAWAKLLSQELIPNWGFGMNLAGEFSNVLHHASVNHGYAEH
jgi:hypothetical protein